MTTSQAATSLVNKLNPSRLGYSPKMAAIVGAILGHDYGSRDRKGYRYDSLSITSDGFLIGNTVPVSSGAFLGSASDFDRNLTMLLADAKLTTDERITFNRLYSSHVTDWRSTPE